MENLWKTDNAPLRAACSPRARCHDFRSCEVCARIRQARIADAAERLASRAGPLAWTTLQPGSAAPEAIAEARAEFLRKTAPVGAVWTVEQAPETGNLHLNILTPRIKPVQLRHAAAFHVPEIFEPRRVAAYISKRGQMPPRELYPGRLYGTSGPLWQWLAGADAPAVVAAAKTQHDIDPAPLRADSGVSRRVFVAGTPHQWADYREIAARRLPDLMRAVPLFPSARHPDDLPRKSASGTVAYRRPTLNSKRVRWMSGTLATWEKDWKPKSCR